MTAIYAEILRKRRLTIMSTEIADRVSGTPRLNFRETAVPIALLAGSLVVYAALRTILLSVAANSAQNCLWLDSLACIGAATLSGVRYAEIPAVLRIMARGIGGIVLVQVAFDGLTMLYAPSSLLSDAGGSFFRFGTCLGLAAGIAALWRPSFLLPLLFHYVTFRHQYNVATGIPISATDYLSMLDIGEFVTIGALMAVLVTRPHPTVDSAEAERLKTAACRLIWACAIGAHLGNYFVSAWTKIRTGGDDPFFWLLHNPTQTSILIGLERGDNPLAAWPWLVQLSWEAVITAGVLLNLFVLGTQLAAPLAIVHRRVLMTLTLLFDLFHIGVYLTLGALFFYWIAVNLLIYLSARRIDDKALTPVMKLVMLAAVITGHFIFYTSHLGWLDGAKLASPRFFAETRDGRQVAIPSVYFGLRSYSIAQAVLYTPDGHFPVRIGGNSYNQNDWKDAQSCGPQTGYRQNSGASLQAVESMVRETDAAMRRHPVVKEDNLYYVYPHHMVANPWMFRAFNRLSIDDITRYHYVVESVCLSLRNGTLVRDVRKQTDDVIDVRP